MVDCFLYFISQFCLADAYQGPVIGNLSLYLTKNYLRITTLFSYNKVDTKRRYMHMSTDKRSVRYDEEFKRTLVNLYQNGGQNQEALSLCKEYGVSLTSLARWIKQYSTVKTDDGEILTAKQVKDLQKRNAQLEEELLILKKRLPYSHHTQATIRCNP